MEFLNTLIAAVAEADQGVVDAATGEIIRIASTVMTIIKIVIPILLLLFGSIDLGKAVVAGKDDEIKKAQGLLVKRIAAAALVFLLGTLINLALGLIAGDEYDDSGINQVTQIEIVEKIA